MLSEVVLYEDVWVDGLRAEYYLGPISYEMFIKQDEVDGNIDKWFTVLLDSIRAKADSLGANAVVGVEIALDPYAQEATGLSLQLFGTAAKLS